MSLLKYFFGGSVLISDKVQVLLKTSWCWFAREIIAVSGRKIWVGQVHDDGNGYSQFILEVDADTGVSTINKVGTVIEWDDHNEPSILVRKSDNRLFTTYCEHQGVRVIRTRISTNPLDATSWQNEKTYDLGSGHYTYPSCFQTKNEDIYIFVRDDSAQATIGWSYIKSTDGGESFSGRVLFFYGDGARGYLNTFQDPDNLDRIHFLASGGHPVNTTVCKLFHFYFDASTETFHKSDGADVTADMPLTGSSDMTVVMDNVLPSTGWIEDLVVDEGRPRILMTFIPNAKNVNYLTKDLYYSEWTGNAWTSPYKIHTAMSRFIENDYLTTNNDPWYPPNSSFMRNNANIIIASKEVNGILELFKIERFASDSFSSAQLTFNSTVDQWRPITANIDKMNVFWLNKTLYNFWRGDYNQELIIATV